MVSLTPLQGPTGRECTAGELSLAAVGDSRTPWSCTAGDLCQCRGLSGRPGLGMELPRCHPGPSSRAR